jgi:hypothetical protein
MLCSVVVSVVTDVSEGRGSTVYSMLFYGYWGIGCFWNVWNCNAQRQDETSRHTCDLNQYRCENLKSTKPYSYEKTSCYVDRNTGKYNLKSSHFSQSLQETLKVWLRSRTPGEWRQFVDFVDGDNLWILCTIVFLISLLSGTWSDGPLPPLPVQHVCSKNLCLFTKLYGFTQRKAVTYRSNPKRHIFQFDINPLYAEFNLICQLLALLGAHRIFHVSRIRVKYTAHERVQLGVRQVKEGRSGA